MKANRRSFTKNIGSLDQQIDKRFMRRLVYKHLVDTNPKYVEKRLKERKKALYDAALMELSPRKAKQFVDIVYWWV